MKKILFVLVAILIVHNVPVKSAQMFLSQPNQTLSLQEEQVYDTTAYRVVRAACSYNPKGNQVHKETGDSLFYMIMSFYGAEGTNLPQLQFHILSKDTLCITREDNIFPAIRYWEPVNNSMVETKGVEGDFSVEFVEFDASKNGFAAYDCLFVAVLEDNRVLTGEHHDVVRFYNADRGAQYPYIPTNEPWTPEGFEQTETTAAPVKVLRNGQVLIIREGQVYDLCGRVVSLKN